MPDGAAVCARSIRIRGVVQGVGFRPSVWRVAHANQLAGWVLNEEGGVQIHLEGGEDRINAFVRDLVATAPAASFITAIEVEPAEPGGFREFTIRPSRRDGSPTARISPDLPVCDECLRELFDPRDRRYHYPYINCTNCGPRYTIVRALPYDRPNTTMAGWPMDDPCAAEYHDPANRRFHAQPVACPSCGPCYWLHCGGESLQGDASIQRTARLLAGGSIVAVKGLGGYHLACDATNATAVQALRERKYRKEQPFAVMARDLGTARHLVSLDAAAEALLVSSPRPIVLAPARIHLQAVAPDTTELGVMLPYTPLHHLLFDAGAPDALVMTSANRSSEPIAYTDEDALARLEGIADAFLIGERPIARRVDDSVVRSGGILRRARGYAPGAVAELPASRPILALGADLKNSITLVVGGQAIVSQHIGDLDQYEALQSFEETIRDFTTMYDIRWQDVIVVHDAHPQYASTRHAISLPAASTIAIQHHRAHAASVLAERGEWDRPVLAVVLDGTGYGDDGAIWGGEFLTGSLRHGFERVAHLRSAALAGGDAAARHPVQAAVGFVSQIPGLPDLEAPPFHFPDRYRHAQQILQLGTRTFPTTSMGRLFDTAAALLGFTRSITYEGQAAMWLEHLARGRNEANPYPFPFENGQLDFRPLLSAVIHNRLQGGDPASIARAFHEGLAAGLAEAIRTVCHSARLNTVVLSGGVFQNSLLLRSLQDRLAGTHLEIWTNHSVPPNDGGVSLGQAALAALQQDLFHA